MSTILTINSKDPETRVIFNQPLRSISEIQIVDYEFPETYEVFEMAQTIKSSDGNKTLLTISPGGYSFKMMLTTLVFNDKGIEILPMGKGYPFNQ